MSLFIGRQYLNTHQILKTELLQTKKCFKETDMYPPRKTLKLNSVSLSLRVFGRNIYHPSDVVAIKL